MKKSILQLFPDYKKNRYVIEQEEPMLYLLGMNLVGIEELTVIRVAYLLKSCLCMF